MKPAARSAAGSARSTALAVLAVVLFLVVVCGRGRRRRIRQAVLDLGHDLWQVFRLGLQVARMRPLEFGLKRAADAPIGVAEMVVDGRVLGLEIDRALEILPPPRN